MNILSWNCQGIGNPWTVEALRGLIRSEDPKIIFLSETRCSLEAMEKVRSNLGFRQSIVVSSVGASGGLCLMWTEEVDISANSFSPHHIDVSVTVIGVHGKWRLTGFYGHPVTSERYKSWELLSLLSSSNHLPWVCIGDFNEILAAHEKSGGATRNEWQMRNFRNAVDACGLRDLGFSGPKYTWWRNNPEEIKVRLDRALATGDWCDRFQGSQVIHLNPSKSDHLPIRLMVRENWIRYTKRKRRFRFEEAWALHEGCAEVIKRSWDSVRGRLTPNSTMEKIKATRVNLLKWSGRLFGQIPFEIQKTRAQLGTLLDAPPSRQVVSERLQLTSQLDTLLAQNETYWRQRSRAIWLRDGDSNSKFFHQHASHRKRKNRIHGIFDSDGRWQTSEKGIAGTAVNYFKNLFTSSGNNDYVAIIDVVAERVTADMNQTLLKEFTAEEIKSAVFQMHPSKAPGPDGMSAFFYQKYWDVVGADVVSSVLEFLRSGRLVDNFNFTHVALIPKVKEPKNMTQLRPISLCNVLYKICAKVLANRLKPILNEVIGSNQSAFVPGRTISDNSIVAFETLHFMKRKHTGKLGTQALKLDMSKAYDRVEWGFLRDVMLRMGFDSRWVLLIMNCVTTVSYSFMINGNPMGFVVPQRGLRQGDPLSPYLFLLCAEVFSSLLLKAEQMNLLHGVAICRGAPSVSHLFFADDSFLFTRATHHECLQLRAIFQAYEKASGQIINLEKSAVSFSANVDVGTQHELARVLGVQWVEKHHNYLGLPTSVGRSRTICFSTIKDRIWKKIQGWKDKSLSFAGREVLLKVIAQAIPIYTMSCFQLPKTLCDEMQQIMARYWWNAQGDKRKIHWTSWDRLCRPKHEGGMGFRSLYAFNQALLAKQVWRILHHPDSLMAKIFKARYHKNCSLMDAKVGHSPSFVWKSLCDSRVIIERGSRWQIGNGANVKVWGDRWLPLPLTFKVFSPVAEGRELTRVKDLIDPVSVQWKIDSLRSWFSQLEVDCITRIPLSSRSPPDRLIWHYDKKGIFSVRSGYEVARQLLCSNGGEGSSSGGSFYGVSSGAWNKLWRVNVPPKVRVFIWRVILNALPTRERLNQKGIMVDLGGCPLCGAQVESLNHILLNCSYSSLMWKNCPLQLDFQLTPMTDLKGWVEHILLSWKPQVTAMALMLAWAVWNERNNVVWQGKRRSQGELVEGTMRLLDDFQRLHQPLTKVSSGTHAKWQKPPVGVIKINVKGTFRAHNGSGGGGLVARNEDGVFVAAKACFFPWVSSPAHAEALAIREALQFASDMNFNHLQMECDALELVQSLSRTTADTSSIGSLVEDCKAILALLPNTSFTHISRMANKVAFRLAQLSLTLTSASTWSWEPPVIITDALVEDSLY